MRPNTILLIAFFFPPSRASGVHRALAMANGLANAGHDVVVLTTTESFFEFEAGPPDYSQVERVDPRIRIMRVPFSSRPAHQNLSLISRRIARLSPVLGGRFLRRVKSFMSSFIIRNGGLYYPRGLVERYRSWYAVAVSAAIAEVDLTKLRGVIATGNPFTAFAIAQSVAGLANVPYALDYRDPWKIDVRSGQPQARTQDTEQLEASLIDGAAFVTLPNAYLADEYRRYFAESSDKIHVVENGYDEITIPPVAARANDRTAPFPNLGALGTVSDMWPLEPFGEAWQAFIKEVPAAQFRLAGHLGWFDSGHNPLLAKVDAIGPRSSYVGPVGRDDVASFYSTLDGVVVFLWGDRGLTAGKMYEVGALGIPVLVIQPDGGGARRFLESMHPDAIGVDPDPTQILDGLHELSDRIRNSTPDRQAEIREGFARFERREMLAPLLTLVSQKMGGHD